jgi:4'-phosphopantetheinyl transferase
VVAVARDRRVGVDVERLDRISPNCFAGIAESFAPEERRWLSTRPAGPAHSRAVLRLWTLKEAYAKARGLGLGLPFDSFGFVLAADRGVRAFRPPADDPSGRWWFTELEPEPGVLVAAAVETARVAARELHLHTGFPWRPSAPRRVVPVGPPTPLLDPAAVGTGPYVQERDAA